MRERKNRRAVIVASALVGVLLATGSVPVGAQSPPTTAARREPSSHRARRRCRDVARARRSAARWRSSSGSPVRRSRRPPVRTPRRARRLLDAKGQKARAAQIDKEQDAVSEAVRRLGGKELGRVSRALNAVVVAGGRERDRRPRRDPGHRLGDAACAATRWTCPRPCRTSGRAPARSRSQAVRTAPGITVAVLDSGVDYTHANLGGAGTLAAYEAAYGTAPGDPLQTTRDGLFPTAKVVEGYDFVGEAWPNSAGGARPGSDRLRGPRHARGRHHRRRGRRGTGREPSSRSRSARPCRPRAAASRCCRAWTSRSTPTATATSPTPSTSINMSLGSSFGQHEDDLSFASQNAVDVGVTVVVSAGNSADRPYIVGSPSSTPGVISVAQTQVPSAVAYPLVVTGIIAVGDHQHCDRRLGADRRRLQRRGRASRTAVSGATPLQRQLAAGQGGARSIAAPAPSASRSTAPPRPARWRVLIANNAPGDPPTFSFGGGDHLRADHRHHAGRRQPHQDGPRRHRRQRRQSWPASARRCRIPLVGSMVASSSRGPSMSFDAIKPDIGAPGASVSAIVGTGTGTQAFGGTSGAAPMVAGSAALLLSLDPSMDPLTVKARLMGTGDTDIETNPATPAGRPRPDHPDRRWRGPGRRRGGRLDDRLRQHAGLRGPAQPVVRLPRPDAATTTLERRLTSGTSAAPRGPTRSPRPSATPTTRRAGPSPRRSSAATPSRVGAGKEKTVTVRLRIDPSKLPAWPFTFAPSQLGNGSLLNGPEFDGYLTVSGGGDEIHVPWHVLPRAVGQRHGQPAHREPRLRATPRSPSSNGGAIDGEWSAFALTGTSGRIPRGQLPGPGENLAADRPEGGRRAGVPERSTSSSSP